MAHWRCYYHFVWACRKRAPLLDPERELLVRQVVEEELRSCGGALLAFNAVADHVHIAAAVPPQIAVMHLVRRIKGVSSRRINIANQSPRRFSWQRSYGVHTFGYRALPRVIDYIDAQKRHHR